MGEMRNYILFVCALFVISLLPSSTFAASAQSFEVSGWIPYWRTATGTADVMPNLKEMSEINPFVYTVKSDFTLKDNGSLSEDPWLSLITAAKQQKVRVIPTIMWSDGDSIHTVLSDSKKRQAFEDTIVSTITQNGYDGIDIDFEGKHAEDKDNFSNFLKGLAMRMPTKWLMCTIEARTPADSLYTPASMPDKFEYANDYVAINKYCDRVRLMTYDQESADLTLNASSTGPYTPIADSKWVEKVVNLAAQTISKSKLMIGVATYGYEYDTTAYADGYTYDLLWAFNPRYATDIAKAYNITPARNSAGEMSFSYIPTSTAPVLPGATTSAATVSMNTNGDLTALAAMAVASTTNSHMSFRFVDWSDAYAIAGKVALAQKLGVRGISIFKLDGGEDPNLWTILQGVKGGSVTSQTTTTTTTTTTTSASASSITHSLEFGDTGADVKTLQIVLNSNPSTQVAQSGVGSPGSENTSFGPATLKALQKFQVKYGIAKSGSSGYGYVGPATRAKLNSILAGL
jgi:spore germination protein YaaH